LFSQTHTDIRVQTVSAVHITPFTLIGGIYHSDLRDYYYYYYYYYY